MKYQKPIVQDMSKLSFAEGACLSGLLVGMCNPNGFVAGTCGAVGQNAGVCGPTGTAVTPDICSGTGIGGLGAPNCNPHGGVASS